MSKLTFAKAVIALGVILLAIGVFVGGGALWSYYSSDESSSSLKSSLSASSPAATKNDVQIDGWIDDRRISPGDTIKFWVVVQNPLGAAPISNVGIAAVRTPNFSVPPAERSCWKNIPGANSSVEFVPDCRDTSNPKAQRLPVPMIAGGGSVTVEGHLVAGERRGKFGVSVIVGWIDPAGASRRKPLSIAPVVVESSLYNRALNAAKVLQTILKDFALPLAILWFGLWIKGIESEREDSRKKSADRVARVQQTWTLMLPKLHSNTEKYYITLMSLAGSVDKYCDKNPDYAFFFYASFFAKMKRMFDDITGFYLKDLVGEDIVSFLWEAIMDEADKPEWFGREVREQLQITADPTWTYFEFRELLRRRVFREARDKFVAGLPNLELQRILFRLFRKALRFETNICYVYWYGAPPEFPADFEKDVKALETALGAAPGEKRKTLLAMLSSYPENAAKRVEELQDEIATA